MRCTLIHCRNILMKQTKAESLMQRCSYLAAQTVEVKQHGQDAQTVQRPACSPSTPPLSAHTKQTTPEHTHRAHHP